jgi:hypothetical protein
MAARFGFALSAALLAATPAIADTVIVEDNFDSYATDADFLNVWGPTIGNGSAVAPTLDGGIITTNTTTFPGLQGKAIDHVGGSVNQYGGVINQPAGEAPAFQINPSATQSIFLSADIYESGQGNERIAVGLRHVSVGADATVATTNLLDLGFWNANPTSATVPDAPTVSTGYAYRVINFGTASAPLTGQPNWQFFNLPTELDRTTDADTLVNISDIGAGWHRYTATITPTKVTLTIDLFRDGLRNTSKTPDPESGIRPGTAGVDATIELPIATLPAGFNSLRIGGASGVTSPGPGAMAFDNVVLKLLDVAVPTNNADFNGDNIVDGKDFLIWQRGFGAAGALATGDANGDLAVNDADLTIWKTQFGTDPTPVVGAAAAVPEPTTLGLAGLALVGTLAAARRRK